MKTFKAFLNAILYGFSTLTLFPEEIEVKRLSEEEILAEAWRVTGENLQNAMDKVTSNKKQ